MCKYNKGKAKTTVPIPSHFRCDDIVYICQFICFYFKCNVWLCISEFWVHLCVGHVSYATKNGRFPSFRTWMDCIIEKYSSSVLFENKLESCANRRLRAQIFCAMRRIRIAISSMRMQVQTVFFPRFRISRRCRWHEITKSEAEKNPILCDKSLALSFNTH